MDSEPKPTGTALIAQELGGRVTHFEQALTGTGISPKKFVRVVMTAVALNPDLLNCDRRSLMNAAMKAANDGLLPDGYDGALVPFDGKVTWMPMIGGIRKKVRRSGEVTTWDVTAVHAKDRFDFELGDDPFIKHKPWDPPQIEKGAEETEEAFAKRLRRHLDRGELTHVYSVAKIKGGDKSRDVMTRAEVELVRDTYARKNKKGEFSPAWRKSFPEMAKKTVARRHAKSLPMSTDILALLSRDDELYDLERERGDRVQAPSELSARLDFLAGVDTETGETSEIHDSEDRASTPPSQMSAAPHDAGGSRHPPVEGAAQPSPPVQDARPPTVEAEATPKREAEQGAQISRPGPAPDLLTPAPTIEERGEATAKRGRMALEQWVNNLPPDEMAKVSLAQLKAWRIAADKVVAGNG